MYIDGFLLPVPSANKETYRAHEAKWWPAFRDLGAISMVVGWGDDVSHGQLTDFYRAVDAKEGETVVLCWMIWPDRATRDAGHKAFMEMEDTRAIIQDMPFDGKRMVFGGFAPILVEGAA